MGITSPGIRTLGCFVLMLSSLAALPQPVNDDQCFPTPITFTNPLPCPTWDVDSFSIAGNNLGATADTLQPQFMNCQTGGNMPGNSADVWYIFQAPAERVHIRLSGLLTNVMALFRRESGCMNMTPVDCGIKAGAPLDLYCDVMLPGEYYVLQVGGGTTADQNTFNLKFYWMHPCDDCMQNCVIQAYPPPVNGYYNPGDTVTFAYVVRGYKAYGQDFFHGISPDFGTGWDLSSLNVFVSSPPTPASGNGNWAWFNNVLDEANNPVDGFFYDGPTINGNPADNKGDAGDQYSQWIFYWRIRTKPTCGLPEDLSVYVYNYSDFQTGNGTNPSCKYDADATFKATLICCESPNVTVFDETCPNMNNGSLVISVPGSMGPPWDFLVYNSSGNLVFSALNQAINTATVAGLPADDYTILTKAGLIVPVCWGTKNVKIRNALDLTVFQTNFSCSTSCTNAAMIMGQGNGNYTYLWQPTNQVGATAQNLCPATYTVTVTSITNGCSATFTLPVTGLPPDDATVEYYPPDNIGYCNIDTASPRPGYIAVPGGTFAWNGPPGNLNTNTGVISLIPTITAGTYTLTYTTPGPCPATDSIPIVIKASPAFPLVLPVSNVCYDNQPITLTVINGGTNDVIWADTLNFWTTLFVGNPYVLPALAPGTYNYFVILNDPSNGCFGYPNQVTFTIFPLPTADAGLSDTICPGGEVVLSGNGGTTYLWSPNTGLDNPNSQNPLASPSATTTYSLTVTSADGCSDGDTVTIFVGSADCDSVTIYTGLSPNGDGLNDFWAIVGIGAYKNNNVSIFNRWGDLVWHHSNYDNREVVWRGTNQAGGELPAGTYFFVISTEDFVRKGWIELTR